MTTKTDPGQGQEHELVLGNKQLLSGFFIVVVLLGVFFTMGYIIGRNTSVPGAADAAQKPSDTGGDKSARGVSPDAPGAREPDAAALAPPDPPSTEVLTQRAKPVEERRPETPTVEAPVPTPAPPVVKTPGAKPPVAKTPVVKTAVVKTPPPEKPPETAAAPLDGRKYLQVMAVKRPDAEKVQKILSGRGFPVTLRESSKEGLFRVLVGPYQDRPALGKAKDDLKSAGFDAIIAR